MKLVLQIIGFLLILLILLTVVLFFLDSKNLLRGDLAVYVNTMHGLWDQSADTTIQFFSNSGITDNAANLLSQGADKLRSISPAVTIVPVVDDSVPSPTPPAIIIITPDSN